MSQVLRGFRCPALLLVTLLAAGQASAIAMVQITWTGTSGTGTTGTSSITAAPGDLLTAAMFISSQPFDPPTVGYGISLRYDTDLADELDLLSATELVPAGFFGNGIPGVTVQESTLAQEGLISQFDALAIVGVTPPFQIASLVFQVTGNVASDGEDLFPGLFDPGIDALQFCAGGTSSGFGDCPPGPPSFLPARVDRAGHVGVAVPEPHAIALFAIGALLFARTRRASHPVGD